MLCMQSCIVHAVHASDRGDIGFEDEGLSRNQRRRRRQKAGRAPGRAPVAAGSLPTEDQAAAEAPSPPLVKAALAAGTTPAASSLIACSPTSVTELSPILGAVSSRRRLEEGLDAAAVEAGPTRLLQSWVELHLVPLSGSVLRTSISIGCEEARARERLEREAAASLLHGGGIRLSMQAPWAVAVAKGSGGAVGGATLACETTCEAPTGGSTVLIGARLCSLRAGGSGGGRELGDGRAARQCRGALGAAR